MHYKFYNKTEFDIILTCIKKIKHSNQEEKHIILKDINGIVKRKIIYNLLKLFYAPHTKSFDFLNTYKKSGFVNDIKAYRVESNNNKYTITHLIINPIVKKIVISKNYKLQIPNYLLTRYLRSQLGTPKNYVKLNNSIHRIHLWYKEKGFDYIKIDLLRIKKSLHNNIYMKINEGLISNTYINCVTRQNRNIKRLQYVENRIIKELYIFPGKALNIKKIEIGIKKLKDAKLISTLKYKISSNDKELKIIIHYDLYKDYMNYVYIKYSQLYKNIHHYTDIVHNMCRFHKLLIDLLNQSFDRFSKLNNYLKILEKSLGFRYWDRNKKAHYKDFMCDIRLVKNNNLFNISMSNPNINTTNNVFMTFTLNFYKNKNCRYFCYPFKNTGIKDLHKTNIWKSDTNSILHGICIKSIYNLFDNLDVGNSINVISDLMCKNSLLVRRCFNIMHAFKQKYKNKFLVQNLKEHVKQKLLEIHTSFTYYTLYPDQYITSGTFITSQLISVVYLPFRKLKILHNIHNINQYLNISYYKNFILPTYLQYSKLYKSTILTFIEIYFPIDTKDSFNIAWNNLKKYSCKYPYKILYRHPYYFTSYNIEYHILLNSYCSLYIFYSNTNKLDNMYDLNFTKNSNIYVFNKMYNYALSIGSGIQVNIPVKSIPPLRIEYCTNNKNETFLQLHFHSKYQEYN